MGVNTVHPDYKKHEQEWFKCRDVVQGSDAVKRKADHYLPRLAGMDATDYEAYKARAMFYAATDRTIRGCTGAVMRKPADIQIDTQMDDWMETMGIGNESFDMMTKQVLDEVLTTGRCGLLIDAPAGDGAGDDPQPYLAIYFAENITNWKASFVNGQQVLTMVVLKETYLKQKEDDEFVMEEKIRYRVLRLEDGVYTQQVWVSQETKDAHGATTIEWVLEEEITPKARGGKTMDHIPFVVASATTTNVEIEKSPVLDLAEVNLSHYRTSADLEHGRHFTALPTPWAAGFDMKGGILKLGSGVAWTTENPSAQCGFLEFSGSGLKSLQEALTEKEQTMGSLGAKLLEGAPSKAETLGAVRMRHAGEHAVLVSIAIAVSEALTNCLAWAGEWLGLTPDQCDAISVALNEEYDTNPLDPAALQWLLTALQGGVISYSVFFYNLKKGGMYPDGTTEENETGRLQSQGPLTSPVGDTTGSPGAGGTIQSGSPGNTTPGSTGTPPTVPIPAGAGQAGAFVPKD